MAANLRFILIIRKLKGKINDFRSGNRQKSSNFAQNVYSLDIKSWQKTHSRRL